VAYDPLQMFASGNQEEVQGDPEPCDGDEGPCCDEGNPATASIGTSGKAGACISEDATTLCEVELNGTAQCTELLDDSNGVLRFEWKTNTEYTDAWGNHDPEDPRYDALAQIAGNEWAVNAGYITPSQGDPPCSVSTPANPVDADGNTTRIVTCG